MKLVLKPGDCLLYRNTWSFIGWVIRVKTWSPVNHVEVYIGDGHVISARSTGTRIYPVTFDNLYEVRRPTETVDLSAAMKWFMEVANGQGYDWLGLLRFVQLGKPSLIKQFCSELATRWFRKGKVELFTAETDADKVSPGMLRTTIKLPLYWSEAKGLA